MEFALDVEIQTPEFFTTQENLVSYIDRVWNTPKHLQEFGMPVCVISAGMHDVKNANISVQDFLRNVKFLLTNFKAICGHIIWLGSTAPSDVPYRKYVQTIKLMKEWDSSVKEMLRIDAEIRDSISFIDIYNASLNYGHENHLHMNNTWYQILGDELIIPLMVSRKGGYRTTQNNCGVSTDVTAHPITSYPSIFCLDFAHTQILARPGPYNDNCSLERFEFIFGN